MEKDIDLIKDILVERYINNVNLIRLRIKERFIIENVLYKEDSIVVRIYGAGFSEVISISEYKEKLLQKNRSEKLNSILK